MSNKVYTRKGDNGTTSLLSGKRVSKLFPEIKAVGALDELNSFIGLLRSEWMVDEFEQIQWNLFNAGSMMINDNETSLIEVTLEDSTTLENLMDKMSEELPELKNFILPKGSRAVSLAHICRTIARKTEIAVLECQTMTNFEKIHPITKYLNRLSDYFFVLARYIGHKQDINETIWKNQSKI